MDVKKHKVPKQQKKSGGVDLISRLPDALLHHILSFLPIEEAVTTCILSTRWRYVWTSLPILNFVHWRTYPPNPTHVTKFINFLDRFLLLHDMNVQKFSLHIGDDDVDESHVKDWISKVIRHKVQELSLALIIEHPFVFPPNLVTCESLVKLTVDGSFNFELSAFTCFSSLKILCLTSFNFPEDYPTQQLFSNCPVLEELILDRCIWGDMKNFNISGTALKRLTIEGYDGLSNSVIEINAPNLIYLRYLCFLQKDYILCNFSSLTDAGLCLINQIYKRSAAELSYCVSKFLGRLSNVKVLQISRETLEMLSNPKDLLIQLPAFHNLIRLEVSSRLCCSSGRALLDLLQISPNLKYLSFAWELAADKECLIFEKVPQCLLLHLKEVKFKLFVWNEKVLYVLKFFLKNARVLERMTISSCSSSRFQKRKLEIAKELLMLPRGSTNCVIEFS